MVEAVKRFSVILYLVVSMCYWESAYSMQLDYGVGYSRVYSDNIRRVSGNEEKEITDIAVISLDANEDTPTLQMALTARAEYFDYKNDVYADTPQGYLNSNILWSIVDRRLSWSFIDYFSQVQILSSSPDTRDNIQDTNIFLTGPDVMFNFGRKDTVRIGMRLGDSYYELTTIGSKRRSAFFVWEHRVGSPLSVSANYETSSISYDDEQQAGAGSGDFKRQDIYGQLRWETSSKDFVADIGGTVIQPELEDSFLGYLARMNMTHRASQYTAFDVRLSTQYSDASQEIANISEEDNAIRIIGGDFTTPDIYKLSYSGLAYNYRSDITGLRLMLDKRRYDYRLLDSEDRQVVSLTGVWDYLLSDLSSMSLQYGESRADYLEVVNLQPDRSYKESRYSVGIRRSLNRKMTLTLEGSRLVRVGPDNINNLSENLALLSISYNRL